jgi:hypothetical protein
MSQLQSVAKKPTYDRDTNNNNVLYIVGKSRNTGTQISMKNKGYKSEANPKQQEVEQKTMLYEETPNDRHQPNNQPTHQPNVNNEPAPIQAFIAE